MTPESLAFALIGAGLACLAYAPRTAFLRARLELAEARIYAVEDALRCRDRGNARRYRKLVRKFDGLMEAVGDMNITIANFPDPDAIDLDNARPVADAAGDVFDMDDEWPSLNGNTEVE